MRLISKSLQNKIRKIKMLRTRNRISEKSAFPIRGLGMMCWDHWIGNDKVNNGALFPIGDWER